MGLQEVAGYDGAADWVALDLADSTDPAANLGEDGLLQRPQLPLCGCGDSCGVSGSVGVDELQNQKPLVFPSVWIFCSKY